MSKNIQLSRKRRVVQKSSLLYRLTLYKNSKRHGNVKELPIVKIMYPSSRSSAPAGQNCNTEYNPKGKIQVKPWQ